VGVILVVMSAFTLLGAGLLVKGTMGEERG
jgi:hypothetical protein